MQSVFISFGIGLLFAGGITLAAAIWQGTEWIQNGAIIDSQKTKDNFDYLYAMQNVSHAECNEHIQGIMRYLDGVAQYCNGTEWLPVPEQPNHSGIVTGFGYGYISNGRYLANCTAFDSAQCVGRRYRYTLTCPDDNVKYTIQTPGSVYWTRPDGDDDDGFRQGSPSGMYVFCVTK